MLRQSLHKNLLFAAAIAATTAPIIWVALKPLLCPENPYCDVLFSSYAFFTTLIISGIGIYYFKKFNEYSIKDLSTGTYTKNFFFDTIHHEVDKSKRYSEPLTIIIFSLDELKAHLAKNNLSYEPTLQKICKKVFSSIRTSDTFSSLSNEEFALLLPHTSVEGARTLAYRLGKIGFDLYGDRTTTKPIEISFGLSDFEKSKRNTPNKLYEAAAIAHAAAKNSVRNKVIAYGDPGMLAS